MSKPFISGMMIVLMLAAQPLVRAQTTAPSTQPMREKFVYHPLLVDSKWFSTLLDIMLDGRGGGSRAYREEQALIAAAATNPSKRPPINIPSEATDPMLPVRDRFAVAHDPKDQSMIVSTTVADWPAVKRAIDQLQETVAVISVTATIVELPLDNAAEYTAAIRTLETQTTTTSTNRAREANIRAIANAHGPVRAIQVQETSVATQAVDAEQAPPPTRIVREANGIEMVIADGDTTKLLKTIDASGGLKPAGAVNSTTQANVVSMLALTGNGAEMFSSEEAAKARRRADVELLVQFKPTATVDGAVVMDLATVVRQRGDENPTPTPADVADHSTLTRLAMELNQSIVLFGPALRRTDQARTPVVIFLNVSVVKDP